VDDPLRRRPVRRVVPHSSFLSLDIIAVTFRILTKNMTLRRRDEPRTHRQQWREGVNLHITDELSTGAQAADSVIYTLHISTALYYAHKVARFSFEDLKAMSGRRGLICTHKNRSLFAQRLFFFFSWRADCCIYGGNV